MAQGFSREPGTHGPLEEVPKRAARKITLWAVAIALGGFLLGFDTGAPLYVRQDFALSSLEQSSVVSVLLIGAVVGSVLSGKPADRIGLRRTLGLAGLVLLGGTAVVIFADGFLMLLTGRIVLGLSVGAASATVPVYLLEIRGRLLTLNQLMITVGILATYLVNLAFSTGEQWRAMFAVGAVPAALLVAATLWLLPESPQWPITHGRAEVAHRGITTLIGKDAADHDRALHQRLRSRQ
ncbi:MFS transporter [Streptomyces albidoflavus]|uniref:MFS transporter n=1 Tax=Streptomyces TaxID=1883 RepID=UPI0036D269DA